MAQHALPPHAGHGIEDLFCQAPRLGPAGEEGRETQVGRASKPEPAVGRCARGPVNRCCWQLPTKHAAKGL